VKEQYIEKWKHFDKQVQNVKTCFHCRKTGGYECLMEMGHHKKSLNFEVPLFGMPKISAHATRKFSNYCPTKLVPH